MTDKQEPVAWKHDCAGLCTNDVELWIDACPHCGKPRAAPPAQPAEPDMRHPKIQALIGSRARCQIELQLVEQLLEDPNFEATSMDMEHWGPMHDKLKAILVAAAQPAPAQEPQPVSNTDELPQRLSDERIMHFWDIHAGMPTEKYPLNYKDVRAFARAIEAAIVPPGYVVVPVEPTPEIITDGVRALYDASWGDFDAEREEMIATYRAMIAAAQKASHDPR